MPNTQQFPSYTPPIQEFRPAVPDRDDKLLATARTEHTAAKHARSLALLIHYLDPTALPADEFQDGAKVSLSHGSVQIHLERKGPRVSIRCPFVKLTDKGRVAAYRKCAELNMRPLMLAQIRMKGEELAFEFADELELYHPDKILDVLREIASWADHYDDFFVEKFSAIPLGNTPVARPAPEVLERAYGFFTAQLTEMREYIQLGETLHNPLFSLDSVFYGFHKIVDVLRPRGLIQSTLGECFSFLYSGASVPQKVERARKDIDELAKLDAAKFADSIYQIRSAIPLRRTFDFAETKDFVAYYAQHSLNFRQQRNPYGAASCLMACFMILCARYTFDRGVEDRIRAALQAAGGKTWEDAAHVLMECASSITNGKIEDFLTKAPESKSVLQKMFGGGRG